MRLVSPRVWAGCPRFKIAGRCCAFDGACDNCFGLRHHYREFRVTRKFEVAVALAGLIIGFAAWRWPATPKPEPVITPPAVSDIQSFRSESRQEASLLVSGAAAHVIVRVGVEGAWYKGGTISSASSRSTVYLPLGQPLTIKLTGAASLVQVESPLMPYIQVENVAAAARVVEI